MLLERAYAKINLTLDVIGKRTDGYHEVDMVMQSIDLSDQIWLEELSNQRIELESNVAYIPQDARNLAVAAALAFQRYSGIRKGLKIWIDKQIPVAAGLAGGSTNAAAVLRGLNRLWRTNYSVGQLAEIGAQIGSDVPFCVYGGCAVARGRGEIIETVRHSFRPWVILVKPSIFVSTADIYRALKSENYSLHRNSTQMIECLQAEDFIGLRESISNTLKTVTYHLYPEVELLAHRVSQVIHAPVHMSGSGPTLFALVPNQTIGQRVYNALRGFTKEVYLCRFVV